MVNSAPWVKVGDNAFHAGASRTGPTLQPRVRMLSGSGLSLRMRTRRHMALSVGGNRSRSLHFDAAIRNPTAGALEERLALENKQTPSWLFGSCFARPVSNSDRRPCRCPLRVNRSRSRGEPGTPREGSRQGGRGRGGQTACGALRFSRSGRRRCGLQMRFRRTSGTRFATGHSDESSAGPAGHPTKPPADRPAGQEDPRCGHQRQASGPGSHPVQQGFEQVPAWLPSKQFATPLLTRPSGHSISRAAEAQSSIHGISSLT